jgi:hypothetical protein
MPTNFPFWQGIIGHRAERSERSNGGGGGAVGAHANIAVIKYWGKRDEALILPINDSISVTLDPDHLSATTTIAVSPSFPSDRMWLNGKVCHRQDPFSAR